MTHRVASANIGLAAGPGGPQQHFRAGSQ